MKQCDDRLGYLRVQLRHNGEFHNKRVHRLVAYAFLERNPDQTEVNHKNGDRMDNTAINLEWMTPKENQVHSWKSLGRDPTFGENHGMSKINCADVIEIRRLLASGKRQSEIAILFGVQQTTISCIKLNKTWRHVLTNA